MPPIYRADKRSLKVIAGRDRLTAVRLS